MSVRRINISAVSRSGACDCSYTCMKIESWSLAVRLRIRGVPLKRLKVDHTQALDLEWRHLTPPAFPGIPVLLLARLFAPSGGGVSIAPLFSPLAGRWLALPHARLLAVARSRSRARPTHLDSSSSLSQPPGPRTAFPAPPSSLFLFSRFLDVPGLVSRLSLPLSLSRVLSLRSRSFSPRSLRSFSLSDRLRRSDLSPALSRLDLSSAFRLRLLTLLTGLGLVLLLPLRLPL